MRYTAGYVRKNSLQMWYWITYHESMACAFLMVYEGNQPAIELVKDSYLKFCTSQNIDEHRYEDRSIEETGVPVDEQHAEVLTQPSSVESL